MANPTSPKRTVKPILGAGTLMGVALTALAATGLVGAAVGAETAAPAKAVRPDLSSGLTGWVATDVDFVPVPGALGPVMADPAHPYVNNLEARRTGAQPTFRIADLANPNIKSWAKEIMKRENQKVLAGGIGFTPRSSCMPAGIPAFMMFPVVEPIYFVQTAKQVTMIFTGDAQVRRIYLDVPHSENPKPSWYGESVGHYEGDTLVIDTIGLNNKSYVDNYRTPHTEKLHVVERWRLINDQTLELVFTVDDPDTFNQPWTAAFHYRRVQRPLFDEEVCAENNTHLFDYNTPVADKADF